jgi:hypothetical protein
MTCREPLDDPIHGFADTVSVGLVLSVDTLELLFRPSLLAEGSIARYCEVRSLSALIAGLKAEFFRFTLEKGLSISSALMFASLRFSAKSLSELDGAFSMPGVEHKTADYLDLAS